MVNAITSWPVPAASMLMLELSKWLPDERMHLFKAHLPSSLISVDILLGNPLNPIPDKWIWQVNKHPTSLLLKYEAPVTRMLPCIHFHAVPLLFKKMLFDDGVRKAVTETNVTLSAELQPTCSDASQEQPARHGSCSLRVPLLWGAEVHCRQWPCPKPRQTDMRIQLSTPKVCVNFIYPRCGSQTKGNGARLGSRALCCLVMEGHYRYDLGFCAACEVFCNLYCEKQ